MTSDAETIEQLKADLAESQVTAPRFWHVTDERIRALKSILCELELCDADEYIQERDIVVLLAMLDEVAAEEKE